MSFASYVRNITKPSSSSSYHTYICRSRQQLNFNVRPNRFIKTRDPNVFLFNSYSTSSNSKPRIGFIGWYLGKLDSRPILTKTITTSLIFAAADLTAQVFSNSSGSFDFIRTSRMAAYGLLLLGPSQHIWFNFMSKALPKQDVLSTLKKTFLGQAVYGPANAIVFFSYNAALQGENRDEIVARLKRDVLPTLKTGLCYWPICDFFTYKCVPPHLQPLVNSSCAYLWTIYLTYMASLQKASSN